MNLRSLEIFLAVADSGSVSGAAARLHRVQSNVSTRIKQLESDLGCQLFSRNARGLELTEDGEVLVRYATRMMALAEETRAALTHREPAGPLRIGTMESTAAARLPAVLSEYHVRYPNVDVSVQTDVAEGLVKRVRSREIDVAFIASPVTVPGLHAVSVFTESLVLVTPRDYPDASDGMALNGRTMVAFEAGCAYRRYLEQWLRQAGVTPGASVSVGSYLAMFACVAAGTGFALTPRSVLDSLSGDEPFRRFSLGHPFDAIETLMVWRDDLRSTNLDALRALLPRETPQPVN